MPNLPSRSDQWDAERNFRWAFAVILTLAKKLYCDSTTPMPTVALMDERWAALEGFKRATWMRKAREMAGIPEEEFTAIVTYGTFVLGDLMEGERLVSRREEHEQKMEENADYKTNFETTTFPPGRVVTVVATVVDRFETGQLMESMFGQEPRLVAGCKVTEILPHDLSARHQNLRREVNNALLTDAST